MLKETRKKFRLIIRTFSRYVWSYGPCHAKTCLRVYANSEACASAQSDQGLRCPLKESLNITECMNGKNITECMNGEKMTQLILCACAGWPWIRIFRARSKSPFRLTRNNYIGPLSVTWAWKAQSDNVVDTLLSQKKKKKKNPGVFPEQS